MANGIVLNIDTTKSEFQNPMVQLRQGDGNYQSLDVTVTSNGSPFNLTGWTITFMGTTAGGFKIVDTDSTVTNALQGQFTYTPPKSWGQDQGEFKNAYFKFTKADETASGASFRVNVLDAVDLTAEEAGDYISVVDALIDDVKTSMDNKLAETKKTLADTKSQANTVQTNVNDLNTNVNYLKVQNNAIKTTDNTWTGTNTFNKQIIAPAGVQGNAASADFLNTRLSTFTDFADVAKNMIKYSGSWQIASSRQVNNGPYGITTRNAYVSVNSAGWDDAGLITFIDISTEQKDYYIGVVSVGVITWKKLSNDGKVVHNTGTETVAGDKTFTGTNDFTGPTTLKTGNYGLRVTTAGVQKTSDGGTTWVNI